MILPDGFRDLLPAEAEGFAAAKRCLIERFGLAGYRFVRTAGVEYLATFTACGEADDEMFSFIDQYSGRPACFRYDFTPQIGRLYAAHRNELPCPARLCYEGAVLRNPGGLTGSMRELYHLGAECIGVPGIEADAELIILLLTALPECTDGRFSLFLNDINIPKAVLGDRRLPAGRRDELLAAFRVKDLSEIGRIASRLKLDAKRRALLTDLCRLCGGIDVIEHVVKTYPFPDVLPHVERLRALHRLVAPYGADSVFFDLGETRGLGYHTGILFDGFIEDAGGTREVVTGGRYDTMLKTFCGTDVPATGLAVDMLALAPGALFAAPLRTAVIPGDDMAAAMDLACHLRACGIEATVALDGTPASDALLTFTIKGRNVAIAGPAKRGSATLSSLRRSGAGIASLIQEYL